VQQIYFSFIIHSPFSLVFQGGTPRQKASGQAVVPPKKGGMLKSVPTHKKRPLTYFAVRAAAKKHSDQVGIIHIP
jgi:hypothetical protein